MTPFFMPFSTGRWMELVTLIIGDITWHCELKNPASIEWVARLCMWEKWTCKRRASAVKTAERWCDVRVPPIYICFSVQNAPPLIMRKEKKRGRTMKQNGTQVGLQSGAKLLWHFSFNSAPLPPYTMLRGKLANVLITVRGWNIQLFLNFDIRYVFYHFCHGAFAFNRK